MKTLLCGFVVIGILLSGCKGVTMVDPPTAYWTFVNTTGVDVLLQANAGDFIFPPSHDTIKAFSSLSYKYGDSFAYDSPNISAQFLFLGTPLTCLTYSGEIVDSLDDIRLLKNFINPDGSSGYYYVIDSLLLAKSVSCN